MRSISGLILVIFLSNNASAQSTRFNKQYHFSNDDEVGSNIVANADSGYTLASNVGSMQVVLRRVDKNGSLIWQKLYGNATFGFNSAWRTLVKDADGGYTLGGGHIRPSNTPKQLFGIMKLNANGDSLWTKSYPSSEEMLPLVCKKTRKNGYVLSGMWYLGAVEKVNVMKLDSSGNIIWQNKYTKMGCTKHYTFSIDTTKNGGFIIPIKTQDDSLLLIKIDSSGSVIWRKSFNQYHGISAKVLSVTDSTYLLYGCRLIRKHVQGTQFYPWFQNYFVHLDQLGNIINEFKLNDYLYGQEITEAHVIKTGQIILTGNSSISVSFYPFSQRVGWCSLIDISGNQIWQRHYLSEFKYPINREGTFYGVTVSDAGIYAFLGSSSDTLIPNNFETNNTWLLQTDSLGCDSMGCSNDIDINLNLELESLGDTLCNIRLTWDNNSPVGIQFFPIRSQLGILDSGWYSIKESFAISNTSILDTSLRRGRTYYYRVLGQTKSRIYTSKIQSIYVAPSGMFEDQKNLPYLNVFPMPASEEIFLQSNYKFSISARVQIMNIQGQVMQERIYTKDTAFNVSELATGMYFVQIKDGGVCLQAKFVKE